MNALLSLAFLGFLGFITFLLFGLNPVIGVMFLLVIVIPNLF